jgi:hypothetical protein
MFDEYVYLSNRKLRQFLPSDPSWWSRIRAKKLGGKAAGVEVSLEFEPAEVAVSEARLRKVSDYIEEISRPYEDPGLTAGEWVYFEGRIGYQPLDGGAVLFCQSGELTPGGNRIVLHGSADNLVGVGGGAVSTVASAGGHSNPGSATSVLEAALGRVDPLDVADRRFWRRFTDNAPSAPFGGYESLTRHVEKLFSEVAGTDWFHNYSPFLAGCARVTAVVESTALPFDVVVASPLFVRSARP